MTLPGEQLHLIACDTAASFDDVSNGHSFTSHPDVLNAHDKVFRIFTDDDLDLQIITVKANPRHSNGARPVFDTFTPGPYLDKERWVFVGLEPRIPVAFVADLENGSFDLANAHRRCGQS